MQNNEMLRALVGLARAVEAEKTPTEDTFDVIKAGLAALDTQDPVVLARVKNEKTRVCPDCATCPHPCGRTADPDIAELEASANIKAQILETVLRGTDFESTTEGLCAIGLDTDESWLRGMLARLR